MKLVVAGKVFRIIVPLISKSTKRHFCSTHQQLFVKVFLPHSTWPSIPKKRRALRPREPDTPAYRGLLEHCKTRG
jgi:hypothetical protein